MKIVSFFFFFYFFLNANAQQLKKDSIFNNAIAYAQKGNYELAVSTMQGLIESDPGNTGYKIYTGRIYSWKGDYDVAIKLLTPIADRIPVNADAMEALVNAHLWAGHYEDVIHYSQKVLLNDPGSVFYNLKKAVALEKLDRDSDALQTIDKILSIDKTNKDARALQTTIYKKDKNAFTFSYLNTSFSNRVASSRHLGYIEYKRNLKYVPLIARINYGTMFGQQSAQFEIDIYPKLSATSYLYINSGIAQGNYIFPLIRGGIEYYKTLHKNIGLSIGVRYLDFKSSRVYLLTGHVSYAVKNWMWDYRPFVNPKNNNLYLSHILSLRKTNEINERFIQFEVQDGAVPYSFYVTNEFTRTNSYRAGIRGQVRGGKSILIQPVFMYEYEEYFPGQFRSRYDCQIIITQRF